MKRIYFAWALFPVLALTLLAGCGGGSGSSSTAALSADIRQNAADRIQQYFMENPGT